MTVTAHINGFRSAALAKLLTLIDGLTREKTKLFWVDFYKLHFLGAALIDPVVRKSGAPRYELGAAG